MELLRGCDSIVSIIEAIFEVQWPLHRLISTELEDNVRDRILSIGTELSTQVLLLEAKMEGIGNVAPSTLSQDNCAVAAAAAIPSKCRGKICSISNTLMRVHRIVCEHIGDDFNSFVLSLAAAIILFIVIFVRFVTFKFSKVSPFNTLMHPLI